MNRTSMCLLASAVLLTATTGRADTVTIAGENEWPPFATPQGKGIGYDLVAAAFKAVDVDVKFIAVPYKRAMEEAKEGKALAFFHADKNPENQDAVLWPATPLFVGHTDFFQPVDRPLAAKSEQELKNGERIALVQGWGYSASLLANGKIVKDWGPDEEKNLHKLELKRVDAVVLWYADGRDKDVQDLLKRVKLDGKVVKAFPGGVNPLYLAFSKKDPKAPAYMAKFEKGMEIIKANGTYTRLLQQ